MDIFTLAKIFSVWKGYVYAYVQPITSEDAGVEVTEKLSEILGKNDFVSSVTQYNGVTYAYVSKSFPEGTESEDFRFVGNIEEGLTEYSDQQAAAMRQQIETEQQNQEQESEEQQDAS